MLLDEENNKMLHNPVERSNNSNNNNTNLINQENQQMIFQL